MTVGNKMEVEKNKVVGRKCEWQHKGEYDPLSGQPKPYGLGWVVLACLLLLAQICLPYCLN